MTNSKHTSNVALFPLCDARSVLMDALRDSSKAPATRGDALVFAWRLELPATMNIAHAANAVLITALSSPRSSWTRGQLLIIRELMVLAGREESISSDGAKKSNRRVPAKSTGRRKVKPVSREAQDSTSSAKKPLPQRNLLRAAKQDKEWWKLVGRSEPQQTSTRGRKRTERSLRET